MIHEHVTCWKEHHHYICPDLEVPMPIPTNCNLRGRHYLDALNKTYLPRVSACVHGVCSLFILFCVAFFIVLTFTSFVYSSCSPTSRKSSDTSLTVVSVVSPMKENDRTRRGIVNNWLRLKRRANDVSLWLPFFYLLFFILAAWSPWTYLFLLSSRSKILYFSKIVHIKKLLSKSPKRNLIIFSVCL